MADSKITGLTELSAAPSAGDLLLLVDVSDTTMAATGTNKKIDAKWLLFTNGTVNTLADNIAGNSKSITNLGSVHAIGILKSTFSSTGVAGASVQGIVDVGNSYSRAFFGYNARWDFTTNLWNLDNAGANDAAGLLIPNNSASINFIFHPSSGATNRTMDHTTFLAGVKFTMTSTGRLGILNTSPTYELDVAGTARVTTGVISPQYYGSISSAGSALLSSTLHATKGKIYLGINAAFDELNTRLGVGTISPARGLHVHGASDSYVRVSTNTFSSGIEFGFDGTNAYLWNYQNNDIIFATNNAEKMRITSAGNITTSGTITCVDLVETSSKEEKENFSQVTGVLDKLSQVKAYYYNDKKDTENIKQTKIGLIAEDFQEFFPEMVAPVEVTEKGKTRQTKGLKYTRLVTLAIQGINELTEIQKRILDRLDNLEQKSYNLKELENGTNYA